MRDITVQGVNMPQAAAPSVSVFVRWPAEAAASVAEQFAKGMAQAGIRSTWGLAVPAQAQTLAVWIDSAAAVEVAASIEKLTKDFDAIGRILKAFDASGQKVNAIEVSGALPRGLFERQLCQAGVRAVVLGRANRNSSMARPLPFGVWEFAPTTALPARRRWLGLLSSRASQLQASLEAPGLAVIDLGQVASSQSRVAHAIDQYLRSVAELKAAGQIRVATVGELAAEYTRPTAARPQRSILRSAA
jgi:hypothetical protein